MAELQAQIAELQGMVRASLDRQQQLERRLLELESPAAPSTGAGGEPGAAGVAAAAAAADGVGGRRLGSVSGPGSDVDALGRGLRSIGSGGVGVTAPAVPASRMPSAPRDLGAAVKFGPGFQIGTEDEEFVLQLHNLTQVDGRFYLQGGQRTTRDTFGVPREWFIFNGRLTRPFEYYVAINQGFNNLNLLDAFLNIHYDDRFQIKVGRYKTPFTYEFYSLPINGLITPERSQFFNNFALNRDVGLMAWGNFLDERLDYAVGIFNGSPNGFLDFDDGKNVLAYVNARPFAFLDLPALQYFNIGGSVDAGNGLQPRIPQTLRLNVPTTGDPAVGVPFLAFRDGVLESGSEALWSLHMAWYYRQLSVIGEWQSGYESYAFRETPLRRTRNVTQSFYVWTGYFLTGEEVSGRGMVKPLRPFDVRRGRRGPGAVELAFRYNYLDVGDGVFDGGFADPRLWTDRVQSIDLGVNWYLSQYVKIFAGWQHNEFGSPVLYRTEPFDQFQLTDDLFWFRFQIYF
jgi:phosphate-selective porin OprO/OprP